MGELVKIGKNRLRIVCDCGEYIHDVFKDAEGNTQFESFLKNKKRKEADTPETNAAAPAAPPKTKKKGSWDIFEDDDETEEGKE